MLSWGFPPSPRLLPPQLALDASTTIIIIILVICTLLTVLESPRLLPPRKVRSCLPQLNGEERKAKTTLEIGTVETGDVSLGCVASADIGRAMERKRLRMEKRGESDSEAARIVTNSQVVAVVEGLRERLEILKRECEEAKRLIRHRAQEGEELAKEGVFVLSGVYMVRCRLHTPPPRLPR